jgi:hypothetical protein
VVEQLTRNEQVEGSTPLGGSIKIADWGFSIADLVRITNPQSEIQNPKLEKIKFFIIFGQLNQNKCGSSSVVVPLQRDPNLRVSKINAGVAQW